METITRKPNIRSIVEDSLRSFDSKKTKAFVDSLEKDLLNHKIKFPLLEYAATIILAETPEESHLRIADDIALRKTIGGNVLLGIMLQNQLHSDPQTAFSKAAEYIEHGAEWYVTDIIGERVFGIALLTQFDAALKYLKNLSKHPSNWVVRSIGPGAHYAIKKGLSEKETEILFSLLLSLGNATDFHVKSGIGWAAKTTAKFHPEIISLHQDAINRTGPWFRSKIKIGLERHAYVQARRSKKHSQ